MKRIYFTLAILFLVIAGMAYLYFSGLNAVSGTSDTSLKIATQRAALVYRIQNDKSILDILDGQDLLYQLIGEEKTELLKTVRSTLLSDPEVGKALQHKIIYISILPGAQHTLNFLVCAQLNSAAEQQAVQAFIRKKKDNTSATNSFSKLSAPGHPALYIGLDHDVLLLSDAAAVFKDIGNTRDRENNPFTAFIQGNNKLTKNSLANLYVNYSAVPDLLKAITPNTSKDEFEELRGLNAYTHLSYNFSKTNIFFNGETQLIDSTGYIGLFLNTSPQKLQITNILPQQTASYTLYNVDNFKTWSIRLKKWRSSQTETRAISGRVESQLVKYHISPDDTFTKYTSNQFITFQLQQGQKLGAISLSNGDKLNQLLLDLSNDVDGTIRQFKEDDMLFYYFGTPFKKFRRPYYIIKDNYLVCSNYASNLQEFLNDYQNNKLLVNEASYTNLMDQLPNTTSILYYINKERASAQISQVIYPNFMKHIRNNKGLNAFDAFVFQISANRESFQTNILMPSKDLKLSKDSL